MEWSKFKPLMGEEWALKFKPFLESQECDNIYKKLQFETKRGKIICPNSKQTFRAFKETPYNMLKVVWWLQNPYPWFVKEVGVADGIALSCANTNRLQPSLEQFYGGMEDDLYGGLKLDMVKDPDLSYLCNQGIMMCNTSLTVEKDKPGSMVDLWLPFMRYFIEEILNKQNRGLVLILSGKCSLFLEKYTNPLLHHIIKTEHPAAAAHEYRSWRHEEVFTKINKLLKEYYDYEPIWDNEIPF